MASGEFITWNNYSSYKWLFSINNLDKKFTEKGTFICIWWSWFGSRKKVIEIFWQETKLSSLIETAHEYKLLEGSEGRRL